jgi:hypothetical protein
MKWFLFLIELLLLFFANNIFFFIPGKYDWFTAIGGTTAISLAAVAASLSSKRFANAARTSKWTDIVAAPPSVIWIFVVGVFCLVGVVRMIVSLRL